MKTNLSIILPFLLVFSLSLNYYLPLYATLFVLYDTDYIRIRTDKAEKKRTELESLVPSIFQLAEKKKNFIYFIYIIYM